MSDSHTGWRWRGLESQHAPELRRTSLNNVGLHCLTWGFTVKAGWVFLRTTLAAWGSGVRTPMALLLAAWLQGDLVVDSTAGGCVLAGRVAM